MSGAHQRKYGLVGCGISYSLSPFIHQFSAASLGLDVNYKLYDVEQAKAEAFFELFFAHGGEGLNVTTPYKELAAQKFAAGSISSVNVLQKTAAGTIKAYSSDGIAFERSLNRIGKSLAGFERIVFLGGGGAVLSVLDLLVQKKISSEIHIYCRRPSRVEEKLRDISHYHSLALKIAYMSADDLRNLLYISPCPTLLVQATSAPHQGQTLQAFADALWGHVAMASHLTVFDMVYGKPSALHLRAQALGLPTCDGLPMLIEQALASQHIWWGRSANYEAVIAEISKITNEGKA